ncbi:family 20 glycosylhydrolase [Pedobacter frigoris]|uniref:family 20 glycosylhydrolase n=1 Tax=Pedobacter frigoris TaxID=2571272 RepID=UPI00292FA5CD|nr:family 20 glycosylhydrolase [Pedobacter frigoris]
MRINITTLTFLSLCLYVTASFGQNKDSLEIAGVISRVSFSNQIKKNENTFSVPAAPEGYKVILKGTDRLNVINAAGKVFTPLQAVKVQLYCQLLRLKDQQLFDMPATSVEVEGTYKEDSGNPKPFVIPALREWHGGTGNFTFTKGSRIVLSSADSRLTEVAALLKKDLLIMAGLDLKIVKGQPKAGDIYLQFEAEDKGLGEEGYLLDIKDHINLNAFHKRGMIWGTRTIMQLLEQDPKNRTLPAGITRDYPKYEIRGLVLDVGRKFFTMDFLRNYVKMMSYYKMSEFHIHLNDNGFNIYFDKDWNKTQSAFRLESTTYPNLTAKDGHYTKKEFMDLQDLAVEYGVNIIPEIDVPAHSLAFTKMMPEIGSKKYGMDHLDLDNPKTYEVISNVFKEYLEGSNPVFKGKVVHIGTDEYDKKESEKFRYFTDYFIKYVQGFGKEARVWGALTHAKGTTPVTVENVTMNAWYNGYAEPLEMKKLGYKLISTPDGTLYIVPAAGYYYDYLNLRSLYRRWEPVNIGRVTFQPGDPVVRGGMFAVWNDKSPAGNGITEHDVHDRVFPAMQVLSQKMWAGIDTIPFSQFQAKSKEIKEGPGLNIAGFLKGADSLVLVSGKGISLKNSKSFVKMPLKEIGYNYTVSFEVKPAAGSMGEKILFSSPNGVFKSADRDNKLGFSREGLDYQFDYQLPENVWTTITLTGTNKATTLYVNGVLKEKKAGKEIQYPDGKTKMFKVDTFVFPLQTLGDKNTSFQGNIRNLKIYNKVLSDEEIKSRANK